MGRRRARRKFSAEYKSEVVELVRTSGRSIGAIAKEMDLTETCVRAWVRQAEVDAGRGPKGALTTAEQDELSRLRQENRTLRMEREILRKAAAFFAKENA
jgi:transposase